MRMNTIQTSIQIAKIKTKVLIQILTRTSLVSFYDIYSDNIFQPCSFSCHLSFHSFETFHHSTKSIQLHCIKMTSLKLLLGSLLILVLHYASFNDAMTVGDYSAERKADQHVKNLLKHVKHRIEIKEKRFRLFRF